VSLGTMCIRADASAEIGTGHVMRCLALAQAWQDAGGTVIFALAESTPAILARLTAEGLAAIGIRACRGSSEDGQATRELSRSHNVDLIVLDGYAFGSEYQRRMKASADLLVIDDNGETGELHSDFLLNQNLHACDKMYVGRGPNAKLLLGPKFALLRREFTKWRGWSREIPSIARRLLITMGGTDPQDLTSRILEAVPLVKIKNLEVRIAVSGSNPRIPELITACKRSRCTARIEVDSSMPILMAWADLAVAAAGSTCWEMCMFGLPAALIDVADNQRSIAAALASREVSVHLGNARDVSGETIAVQVERLLQSRDRREAMSQKARNLVDGHGAERVVAELGLN
jgi:UDP-2,4-diacetamido-2,4,6-trideoxy-beta-L-altropyranose hydrolase